MLRTGVLATAAGGAVLGAAGAASAGTVPDDPGAEVVPVVSSALDGATATAMTATSSGLGPALGLPLNPLADTASDPLDNAAGTQVADFRPLSTQDLTGPLSDGASLATLPGDTLGRLIGGQGQDGP